MTNVIDIVPLPRKNPSFIPWWTIAGFIASCLFGYGLVASFLEDGAEMTAKEVGLITGSMVLVWIAIPGTCYVIAHRFFLGMAADVASRRILLYKRRGSSPLALPFDAVTSVRADDDEFDDKMAAEAMAQDLPQGPRPGQGVGVTNRPLHHPLLVEANGRTYTVECQSKAVAMAAAEQARGVLGLKA